MDFFQEQVGFTVHPDEYAVQIQSKRIYLFHGDGISKKDKGYRILKKIFRNPVNIFLYRWLHPDLGIPLARLTSHTSRKHTANKLLHDEADYLEFAVDKFNSGFDCVIVGHSHRPCLENINGKYFINLGDWINHFSYGVLSKGNFSLNYWKP
jgi:UDP-2,3-diacylglucosamine hydrolase